MKKLLIILLFLPLAGFSQKAFPEAYGAAGNATGGRGGTVHQVTNLNNSGPGSFREAVSGSNRTVVFSVSGTIELTSNLTITSDNLTIAGQTAPIGGISITGSHVFFQNANNIILRYVRFRPDYNDSGNIDALNITDCDDFVIDHCSISWSGDEGVSIVGDSDRWTFSNNIVGESATGMLAGDSNSFISSDISIHNNLWYNTSHRFPNSNASRVDAINNLVHNWNTRIIVIGAHDNIQLNEINNYYQRGARGTNVLSSSIHEGNWLDIGISSQRPNIRIYTDGNIINDVLALGTDNYSSGLYRHRFDVTGGIYAGVNQWDLGHPDFEVNTPFALLGVAFPFASAIDAKTFVENNAGAGRTLDGSGNVVGDWDVIDNRYLGHVRANTFDPYTYTSSGSPTINIEAQSWYQSYQGAVSSTPINTRPANFDADVDGMPDIWEMMTFGSLSRNGTGDLDGDGYTDLEEYLNLVDFQSSGGPNPPPGGGNTKKKDESFIIN
ncbi:pectate lyase [Flavobacteriaceae bacterium GF1]